MTTAPLTEPSPKEASVVQMGTGVSPRETACTPLLEECGAHTVRGL